MKEIKIKDLPEYAKKSVLYEGMNEEETVFVPSKFLIENLKIIYDFKEFKKIIKAHAYFMCELSKNIIDFQTDARNRNKLIKYYIKNIDNDFFKMNFKFFTDNIVNINIIKNKNVHVSYEFLVFVNGVHISENLYFYSDEINMQKLINFFENSVLFLKGEKNEKTKYVQNGLEIYVSKKKFWINNQNDFGYKCKMKNINKHFLIQNFEKNVRVLKYHQTNSK